jgi:UDP-N-acetylglucosamine--N-acetylmuramyl-(pentapeptide) pyrophosphoryl-undecaprenol N-acetylglucosamine transferase
VAEDHQTQNALALVTKNAAVMIKDVEAKDNLIPTALQLILNDDALSKLAENILKLAEKDSAKRIVDEVEKIIERKKF